MQNFKQNQENPDETKVREYINKYIKELQRHFDLSDKRMRIILYKVYRELSPLGFIRYFAKNFKSVVKSFYNKLKRNNNGN